MTITDWNDDLFPLPNCAFGSTISKADEDIIPARDSQC